MMGKIIPGVVAASIALAVAGASPQVGSDIGFVTLFNGTDLSRWKIPEGDNGHWKSRRWRDRL